MFVCVCVCVCVFTCPKIISKLSQVAGTVGEGKSMMLFCGLENGVLMRIAMDAVTGTTNFLLVNNFVLCSILVTSMMLLRVQFILPVNTFVLHSILVTSMMLFCCCL